MRAFLVIDLQKEFSFGNEEAYNKAVAFTKAAHKRGDIILATRFINQKNSQYVKRLKWSDCMNPAPLEIPFTKMVNKTAYGINPNWVMANQKGPVYLYGCDTDACVLAAAFCLFDHDIDFYILTDLCFSSGGILAHERAKSVMKRQFGETSLKTTGEIIRK